MALREVILYGPVCFEKPTEDRNGQEQQPEAQAKALPGEFLPPPGMPPIGSYSVEHYVSQPEEATNIQKTHQSGKDLKGKFREKGKESSHPSASVLHATRIVCFAMPTSTLIVAPQQECG